MNAAERPLRPAKPPRAAVCSGGGVRRTSNRNAGSSAPSCCRSLNAFGWTVLNTGPRTGSTTATTTFKRLGVSNTIPSSACAGPATLTRSPIAVDSTTSSLPVAWRVGFATAVTAAGSPGRYGERIDPERHRSQTARQLARAVDDGRGVGAALRHLDIHGSEPEAQERGRRARAVLGRTLRFASRGLASRPAGCRRLSGRRTLGEVRATRGAARRPGSHQPEWRPRADASWSTLNTSPRSGVRRRSPSTSISPQFSKTSGCGARQRLLTVGALP